MVGQNQSHLSHLLVLLATVTASWTVVKGHSLTPKAVHVTHHQGHYRIHNGEPDEDSQWLAKGSFVNSINSTGWSYLWVKTNPDTATDDTMQAFSAGLVEGNLTASLITLNAQNSWQIACTNLSTNYCVKMTKFFVNNRHWMMEMIQEKAKSNSFWHMVNLYLYQLDGMISVYHTKNICQGCLPELYWDQFFPELEDIKKALDITTTQYQSPLGSGSCSALVKVLPGNEDIYIAHDTWNVYSSMLRILKSYDFGYHILPGSKETVPGRKITFSSYPGLLLSMDDYYVLSSGMVAMETTIENTNQKISEESTLARGCVLEAIRVMTANRLARNIHQWADIFSAYNSGTYNNQWMVLDYNKFQRNKELPNSDLLLVLEQMPGYIMYRDMTQRLKSATYWGSYNAPYFPQIMKISGQDELVKKYGDMFTYENTSRAKIFRRDHSKVIDMRSMMALMRSNNYKQDPLSRCKCDPTHNAELAISARSDLNPDNGTYPLAFLGHRAHGGIDMKLTNSSLAKELSFVAIMGPTYGDIPVFKWSTSSFKDSVKHVGHPDVFKFSPYIFGDEVKRFS